MMAPTSACPILKKINRLGQLIRADYTGYLFMSRVRDLSAFALATVVASPNKSLCIADQGLQLIFSVGRFELEYGNSPSRLDMLKIKRERKSFPK